MTMSNRLYKSYGQHVKRISLQGANKVANVEEKVRFEGEFNHFTVHTFLENYDAIAKH